MLRFRFDLKSSDLFEDIQFRKIKKWRPETTLKKRGKTEKTYE